MRVQPLTVRLAQMASASSRAAHGTRARYRAGCKCLPCRAANSRYETDRAAARRAGDIRDLVDAREAREFIRFLGHKGVGYKSVAAASGVSACIVMRIRSGEKQHIRRHTAARILSVDQSCIADKALVSARPTWQMLDELIELGYRRNWLAAQLGVGKSIQFNRRMITAKSASKVERLYRLVQAGRISR